MEDGTGEFPPLLLPPGVVEGTGLVVDAGAIGFGADPFGDNGTWEGDGDGDGDGDGGMFSWTVMAIFWPRQQ